MSLLDTYITVKKSFIVLISGLSGSGRSQLAKEIERDFKIKLIALDNYCKKENTRIFEVNSEIKIKDWDHIDVYEWDRFNEDVIEANTVVAYGDYFPTDKLKFTPDYHLHVKISKDKLIEKRKEYIKNNPEKCKELLEFIDNNQIELIIKKVTFPYYLEYRGKSKIDKYVSSDTNTVDDMYDQIFKFLMFQMQKYLDEYYAEHSELKKKVLPIKEIKKETSSTEDTEDTEDTETTTNSTEDTEDTNNEIVNFGPDNSELNEAKYIE